MEVSVDIRNQDGKTLSDTPRTAPLTATAVFDEQLRAADAEVQNIIAANLGRKVARSTRTPAP